MGSAYFTQLSQKKGETNMDTTQIESIGSVSPEKISFDKKNPRGEGEEQIKQDKSFKELRKSVRKYGVLVPLVTQRAKIKHKPFKLIDGERRLRAALIENKELVPIHTVGDDESEARILAYNIHMLRKQWSKSNELSSIKEIRDELIAKNPDMDDTELFAKLREITTHTGQELRDLLRLLKYSKETIKKLQDGFLAMSYLIQIDASFLSPLKREFPKLYEQYGDGNLRKILVQKAEDGKLGNTRYLMDFVLKYFKNSKDGKYIFSENKIKLRNAIKMFLDKPEQQISSIVEKMEITKKAKKKKAKKTKKGKKKKKATLSKDDTFEYTSLKISKKQLSRIEDIRPKLEKIAGSFSNEECEYIKEGIYCLEKHCFKAAALMVWSTGISRILKYIESNINDFNKCSKEMFDTPKSFYKYFSKNFQRNSTYIDDIRENSNDRQLLCYICYKKFIDVTQFKKLKNNYDTRNDCAHPTSISLTPHEIIVIFENVYNLLLNNSNLK